MRFTPALLNQIYNFHVPPPKRIRGDTVPDDFTIYARELQSHGTRQRVNVQQELFGGRTYIAPGVEAEHLSTQHRKVHHMISFRFVPTKDRKTIRTRGMALTYCFIKNLTVNFGNVLYEGLKIGRDYGVTRSIIFGSVITDLCRHFDIFPLPHDLEFWERGLDKRALSQVTGFDKAQHQRTGGDDEQEDEEEDAVPTHIPLEPMGANEPVTRAYVDQRFHEFGAFVEQQNQGLRAYIERQTTHLETEIFREGISTRNYMDSQVREIASQMHRMFDNQFGTSHTQYYSAWRSRPYNERPPPPPKDRH